MMTIQHAATIYWITLLLLSAIVVIYVLLVKRLADLSQPMRLRMADIGMALLESDLPESDKVDVAFMLEHAFSFKPAVVMAVAFPIAMVRFLILKALGRRVSFTMKPHSKMLGAFAVQFLLSAIAANPIAGLVIVLELFTFGLVGFLVGGQVLIVKAAFATQRAEAQGILAVFREPMMETA